MRKRKAGASSSEIRHWASSGGDSGAESGGGERSYVQFIDVGKEKYPPKNVKRKKSVGGELHALQESEGASKRAGGIAIIGPPKYPTGHKPR